MTPMIEDITKVEEFLKALRKPVLEDDKKNLIKESVIRKISADNKVVEFVRTMSQEVSLKNGRKALIKERIFNYIYSYRRAWYYSFIGFGKKFVGATMIFVMMVGIFGVAAMDINVAMADTFTVIDGVQGNVVVQRDGINYPAKLQMILQEGDMIVTGDDGTASIKFLDDSIARLKDKTVVVIKKLFGDVSNSSITKVEVEIEKGDLWSRVVNLFNKDSSFSVKIGELYAYAQRAAFTVHKEKDEAKVQVYSSVINMKTPNDHDLKKVKSGETVIADTGSKEVTPKIAVVSGVADDSWAKENIEKDKVQLAQAEEVSAKALKDSAGVLPESPLYSLKALKTGVVQLLTFDDVASKKLDLETAERKFVEWSVLLKDGKKTSDDVKPVFDDFVAQVKNFNQVIKNVRESGDIKYADELKVYLQAEIDKRKNDLKVVLPDSPLYLAKQYLSDAEVASANTDAEKTLIKKDQATQKLSEAQDLADVGDSELAAETIGNYAKTVADIKNDVNALSLDQKTEVAPAIVDTMSIDKDLLSSIQVSSKGDDLGRVAGQVEQLVVDPLAANLKSEIKENVAAKTESIGLNSEAEETKVTDTSGVATTSGSTPTISVQYNTIYGVPVIGTFNNEKPLDPLLDLNR